MSTLAISIKLYILFLSFCLAFGILELAIRYRVAAYPFEMRAKAMDLPYLTEKDKTLRWRFSPYEDGRNSLGLKNREVLKKTPDLLRILFLGDSLVWNGETTSGELYTQIIEKELNEFFGMSHPVEIINAGVPGYTLYQEVEFLKIYGLEMNPNIVILGFVFNDVYYPYLHRPRLNKILGNEPEASLNRFNTHTFLGNIFSKSYAMHKLVYATGKIFKKIHNRPEYPFEGREDFYLAWKNFGWNKTRELINRMNVQLKENKIPLLIVIYPLSDQVNNQYLNLDKNYVLYPQERIKGICDEFGIPCLDLTDAIYDQGGTSLYKDYLHMNEKGNNVIAQKITEFLKAGLQQGLYNYS